MTSNTTRRRLRALERLGARVGGHVRPMVEVWTGAPDGSDRYTGPDGQHLTADELSQRTGPGVIVRVAYGWDSDGD